MRDVKEVERSIIKKFRKEIWCPFVKSIKRYELISPNDNIAVCISGGKDSFLLAKCMQEIARHGQYAFGLKFIVMDPGYSPKNRELIEQNAQALQIPVEIFPSNIFEVVESVGGESACYLCARMRRGYLYEFAKKCGCNKIALGHHFDDVVETALLSMFYGAEVKTMLPKLRSTSHEGMELIRPLYAVAEEDVIAWANYNELNFLNCACRFTEKVASKEDESKRKEMKLLIKRLKESNPDADKNLFRAFHNVNLDGIIGWRKEKKQGTFLDGYTAKQPKREKKDCALAKEENL